MMGYVVLTCLLALITLAHRAAPLLSLPARRRREVRALRGYLLRDVREGRRSLDDRTVAAMLTWCDAVESTGRDLPLPMLAEPPLAVVVEN